MNKSIETTLKLIPDQDSPNPRDLSDFCQKWPDLKIHVTPEQLAKVDLTPEGREVMNWLTILADKVCHIEEF